MSDRKQVAKLFREALAALKGLDVLVNNAGIAGPTGKVDEIAPEEWDRCLAVDITGQFNCTRLAVPHLRKSRNASIVNLSSAAGRLGFPLRTPYSAAKWAVVGFTKSLAAELGPEGIRVNAIQPGIVEGARIDRVFENKARARGISVEAMRAGSALGRLDAHHRDAAADRRRDRVHLLDARPHHFRPGDLGVRRHADAAVSASSKLMRLAAADRPCRRAILLIPTQETILVPPPLNRIARSRDYSGITGLTAPTQKPEGNWIMNKLTKIAAGTLAALTLTVGVLATSSTEAQAWGRRGWGPAIGLGIAAGVIGTAAYAATAPGYYGYRSCRYVERYDALGQLPRHAPGLRPLLRLTGARIQLDRRVRPPSTPAPIVSARWTVPVRAGRPFLVSGPQPESCSDFALADGQPVDFVGQIHSSEPMNLRRERATTE